MEILIWQNKPKEAKDSCFSLAIDVSLQQPVSPQLPVMINKSGLHLIIAELSFNVILLYVRLSLLSSLAVSFCLTQR